MAFRNDENLSQGKAWFTETLTSVPDEFRKLLEDRGIPSSQVVQHVQTIRDKAWRIHTYPCLGEFTFLRFSAGRLPIFPEVFERLRNGEKLLDFATGLGQDLRYFESMEINSSQLAGFDYEQNMLDFGYELFNDKRSFAARLVKADMLDISSFPSDMRDFDLIIANCAIHLFDWDTQLVACKTALKLLKPKVNSMIFGIQLGRESAGMVKHLFVHDAQSFENLWQQASNEFGMTLDVTTEFSEMPLKSLIALDTEVCRMFYSVRVSKLST